MSGKQFNRALTRLKLSINDAAQLLGVDRTTIIRYKSEKRKIPGPVASYLRHLLDRLKSAA